MNEEKIPLRKQAVQLWLDGVSKSSIARRLGKSRLWVIRWINRYRPDEPETSLQNRDSTPK